MITFTQTFTFNEEAVKAFAIFLGWEETIEEKTQVIDGEIDGIEHYSFETKEIDNPETYIKYVERLSKEHSQQFTKKYAEHLKNQELERQVNELKETIEPQLDELIIKPVENALTSNSMIV